MKKRTKVVLILSVIFSFVVASFVFAVQVNAQANCQVIWQNTYDMRLTVNSQLDVSFITQGCTSEANLRMTLNGQVVAGPVNGRVEYHWQGSSSNGEFQFCPELLLAGQWDSQENKCFTLHVHGVTSSVQSTAVPQQGQVNTIVVTATPSSPMVTIVPNGQGGGVEPTKVPSAPIYGSTIQPVGQSVNAVMPDTNLRIRAEANKNAKQIGVLLYGNFLPYAGETTNGFHKVKLGENIFGWITADSKYSSLVNAGTSLPTATPLAVTQTSWTCGPALVASYGATMRSTMEGKPLNVRIGPATSYPKVDSLPNGQMPNGTEFGITGDAVCDDASSIIWWPMSLKLKEQVALVVGWVAQGDETKYFIEVVSPALSTPVAATPTPEPGLAATPAPTMDTVVLNKDDVKVYQMPDTTSKVLFVGTKGVIVPFKLKFITMSKKVWYEVYTGNGTGWIQAEDAIWNGDDPTATPHAA